jgi:8-oxo-dGTP diphosphatase
MEENKYSLGFCFSEDKSHVALINKLKPKWQAGRLNGIGGKKEKGEDYFECMVREFKEETGVLVPVWTNFCTLSGTWGEMHIFNSFTDEVFSVKTIETEQVEIFKVSELPFERTIPNLRWLIPLALDKDGVCGELREP